MDKASDLRMALTWGTRNAASVVGVMATDACRATCVLVSVLDASPWLVGIAELDEQLARAAGAGRDQAAAVVEGLVDEGLLHVVSGWSGGVADDGWPEVIVDARLRRRAGSADAGVENDADTSCRLHRTLSAPA